MTRCDLRHPDGRQCCRPRTHLGEKCLVAAPGALRYEASVAIAQAWGCPERAAHAGARAARDAMAEGINVTVDDFVESARQIANALIAADNAKHTARPA